MKRLTMNQVARANLKYNRKAYFGLALGVFFAVYLSCTAVLCIDGTLQANDEKMARKVGWADTALLNTPEVSDDQLRSRGYFDKIGHVYVTAAVNDSDVFIGRYDDTADDLMYRRCSEGRMPELPGEIAAERSALDKLELENIRVGDLVTLTLKPFDGMSERRTFTLVGILSEQSAYLAPTWISFANGTEQFPAILTHPTEPDCQYGVPVVHRMMTNRPGVTLEKIQADEVLYQLGNAALISRLNGNASPFGDSGYEIRERMYQVIVYIILGGALLLTACVAIASAMESMLAQKTEDIGMMRAVGATKKQIRVLFGRDTWLLTLTALPVGAALGCLTVWMLSSILPDELLFIPAPWLLLPVILLSFLCVFLSSVLPLRRASRQLPMGILRDTGTLRKARRFRSQKQFKAPQLIASRQFGLHPMRQAGSACMAALMLLCALLLGEMLLAADLSGITNDIAFTMKGKQNAGYTFEPFVQLKYANNGLTPNDMNQLRTLPLVSRVNTRLETTALLCVPDELPSYLKTERIPMSHDRGYIHVKAGVFDTLYLDVENEELVLDFPESLFYNSAITGNMQMHVLQSVVGIDQKIMPIYVIAASLDGIDFGRNIVDGNIDLAALDAGKEILVYAPNIATKAANDGGIRQTNQYFDDEIDPDKGDVVFMNDFFYAGQSLSMLQLYREHPDWFDNRKDEEQLRTFYSGAETAFFTPRVGAVLKGIFAVDGVRPFGLSLLTTEKGAAALGLMDNGAESISISLGSEPDIATEEMLENAIKRIGMRRNMTVTNQMDIRRAERAYQMQMMLLFGGMVILFFAVAAAMQVTNASRRIRADERMVGTLRAVGADERALLSCYRLPTIVSSIAGYGLAAVIYLAVVHFFPLAFLGYHLWLLGIAMAMAALNAACAMAGIRSKLHHVLHKSIVENIKEL